jgi:uncharacterized protein
MPLFSPLEARVLGVLAEKHFTTPDYYPLTLNALVAGCNQKTSRQPVMSVTEAEVQMALDELRRRTLVIESYGASGRVMRYAHNLGKVLGLSQAHLSLITVLMLRGPQTPGELRVNCERMYSFPDISSLEAYLDELAERRQPPLVTKLPRQPGSREHRYAHLLCGAVDTETPSPDAAAPETSVTTGELASLKAHVAELRAEVTDLRRLVERLCRELGLKQEG